MSDQDYQQAFVRPTEYDLSQVSAKQALTPLDMNMPRLYGMRWILCFSLDATVDKLEVFDDLRRGLAHTIARFPWISGNIGPEQNSNPEHSRIEVLDGDLGFRFKFNDLTAGQFPSYEELKAAHFPLSMLSTAHLSPLGLMPERDTAPVMAAQANFIKGGLLLTVCAHHSACDATGFNTVLQTWAQMIPSSRSGTSLNDTDPIFNDRKNLMTGILGAIIDNFPEYVLAPTPSAASTDLNAHQMATMPFKIPDRTARVFYISAESLKSLKTAAAAYSANDALHALVWRHVTLARAATQELTITSGDGATALLYAANMRSKVSPPLPNKYTGNASVGNITRRMSVAEMAAPNGLIATAAAIRSSMRTLNQPDRVALITGLIASRPNPTDYKFAYNGFLGPDLSSTSWAELNVFETEWGSSLGKAEAFRVPGEGADGAMIVLPRGEEGGLEVYVALEGRAMERLMADEEFGRWAVVWA